MKTINIGILGCGTVGTGVAKMLIENRNLITSRLGAVLELKHLADLDITTDRGLKLADGVMTDDALKVITDPEIDIIIEMIGGEGIAKDFTLRAIQNGKHVVTSNKALIAAHGNELVTAAIQNDVDIAFEASVGGCMPIIKTLRESLIGNRIEAMIGILNGTCNYILSKITHEGLTFEAALAEAQANGFAEADPTLDIEGIDTAHKLAILSALAYGTEINLADIYVEGISRITPIDIEFAAQFGFGIKLLAISKNLGNAIEARVHPTMIPLNNLLSSVNGSLNAISVTGDAVGDLMLYGHGAGMMPTASAVISDVVDLARDLLCNAPRRISPLSYQTEHIQKIPVLPISEINTYYYIRFSAKDQPNVLSKISGILGNHDISIQSVQQKGRKINGSVPIVMLTHLAKEADINDALSQIADLDVITARPVLIRIENGETEE